MIAIGMLSLSSVTTRAADHEIPQAQAMANARMALMLALGELQKMAGPDTRVTAPADAVVGNTGAPRQVTGVWRSWEGNDHDKSTGEPEAPDYSSKLTDGDLDVGSANTGRFLGWLVSGPESENDANTPPDVNLASNDKVALLSEGTLGDASGLEVHLEPIGIGEVGAYAWWIQGENQKALIQEKSDDLEEDDTEGWSERLASSGRADTELMGFDEELVGKAVSRQSMNLAMNGAANSNIAGENFHDITSYSRGLLTNTATGGWKRDLSLMAEKWDRDSGDLPSSGLPVFTAEPYAESLTASLKMADNLEDASIYPWVEETVQTIPSNAGEGGGNYHTHHKTAMSWNALLDFVSLYKEVQTKASGEPYFNTVVANSADRVGIQIVPARVQVAMGFDASVDDEDPTIYHPRFVFKPSSTMWNPYNVAIEQDVDTRFHFNSLFNSLKIYASVGSQAEALINPKQIMTNGNGSAAFAIRPSAITGVTDHTFKPGESRIYGKGGTEGNSNITMDDTWAAEVLQQPGYSTFGGLSKRLSAAGGAAGGGGAGDTFTVRIEHNVRSDTNDVAGDLYYYWAHNSDKLSVEGDAVFRHFRGHYVRTSTDTAEEMLPFPAIVNTGQTLSRVEIDDSPFLMVSFGLRTIANEGADGGTTKVHTKGYINTKPIFVGAQPNKEAGESWQLTEDSAYNIEMFALNDWNDPIITQANGALNYGDDASSYFGTSIQLEKGLNRWVIAELPTRPLLSLGELQHFDVSFRNQFPPRVFNAIGNSHATPHVGPDQILYDAISDGSYDHSYVSNHVFFDDWFISSIAPDVDENRTLEQVYAEHLSTTTPLPNSPYIPASPVSASDAQDVANDTLADTDVWQDIASKLEVRGMFNVNSTSVEAWKALLSSLRASKVPYASVGASNPDDWETVLDSTSDTPVSRTTVGGEPASGGDKYASVATYTEFTDDQIAALAEEIVEQVKKRGPFLSLSEFVNRQLVTDEELAMAGTIEAALIELSELGDSPKNPYSVIQDAYPEQATLSSKAALVYQFPNAAVGDAAYGTPGWVRQADVLRPLAPILSVRDDSFVIRAYGESRDNAGKMQAKAWCEAVVQRTADYVDSVDDSTEYAALQSEMNKEFGRKFKIVSFRWLSPDEV